jgi:hypothetical protein
MAEPTPEAAARLTEAGLAVRGRLLGARERCLTTLVADWESEAPELDAMIARLSGELSQNDQPAVAAP